MESASKELYDDFRQTFPRKLHQSDDAEVNTSVDTPVAIEPPPKPNLIADWPKNDLKLGQVTAVSIHPDGHPVLFHRDDRVWNEE